MATFGESFGIAILGERICMAMSGESICMAILMESFGMAKFGGPVNCQLNKLNMPAFHLL